MIQHSFGSVSHSNQRRKRNKRNPNWKLVFNGYRVSAGEDEKVLEMDGSDRCTTI